MAAETNPSYLYPTIAEDREERRNLKDLIRKVEERSFAEEIEIDKERIAVFLDRARRAEKTLGPDHEDAIHERGSSDIFKRALTILGAGGLEITTDEGEQVEASQNGLPVSTYLSHGSRSLIELPPGSGDDMINWLTSGQRDRIGHSSRQSQRGAIREGKLVYNRPAATHDVELVAGESEDGGVEYELEEKKGFLIGARDLLLNKVLRRRTKHYGVDLAVNAEYGGRDSQGNEVRGPDGDHGHLYIHYMPPTATTPGSILIGNEGAAPSSPKHSKVGASDPVSATDSSKWDDLSVKKEVSAEQEYENTKLPRKYGGMRVKLDHEKITQITAMQADSFDFDLAYTMPGSNPSEFQANYSNKDAHHKTPEIQPSRRIEFNLAKPAWYKRILNRVVKTVTFGFVKPFNTEIKNYKKAKKKHKIHKQVAEGDERRASKGFEASTTLIDNLGRDSRNTAIHQSQTVSRKVATGMRKDFELGESKFSTRYPSKKNSPKLEIE